MKRMLAAMAMAVLLAGCLEVEQHPPWERGAYDGKTDARVHAAHFRGDRGAWNAAISDRNHLQNEYRRARP
jgi:hypothetical protein